MLFSVLRVRSEVSNPARTESTKRCMVVGYAHDRIDFDRNLRPYFAHRFSSFEADLLLRYNGNYLSRKKPVVPAKRVCHCLVIAD